MAAVTAYFARRSADPQTVADLTADTFAQAITSFATFDPRKGTPRAWVFGIARRIYAAHCQAHSQQRSRVERMASRRELAPDETGDLIDRIDAERAGRALVTRLTTLPAADRAVVELVDLAHLYVSVATGVTKSGHRSVTVKIGKPGIPAGDTMILAFSGSGGPGSTSLGAGGIITGPVPSCVSLPSAPHGEGGSGSTSTVTQAS